MPDKERKVCFRADENGWIFLSEVLGKVIIRAHKAKKMNRKSDKKTQHRGFEFECNKTVKVKSKNYDISKFLE